MERFCNDADASKKLLILVDMLAQDLSALKGSQQSIRKKLFYPSPYALNSKTTIPANASSENKIKNASNRPLVNFIIFFQRKCPHSFLI